MFASPAPACRGAYMGRTRSFSDAFGIIDGGTQRSWRVPSFPPGFSLAGAIYTMSQSVIRPCHQSDCPAIWTIINDGASAYRGIIPADCLHDPYMTAGELSHEIANGVQFWGCEHNGSLVGVMGSQDVAGVTLIRHAYVRTDYQKQGVGAQLLAHLRAITSCPVLIGTWAAAHWAIRFYQRHGFHLVSHEEKERLLRKYWHIPTRQIETSVVLADRPSPV
jgi:N-acetylglutamate synthase-like GNAT family acetyltransferase